MHTLSEDNKLSYTLEDIRSIGEFVISGMKSNLDRTCDETWNKLPSQSKSISTLVKFTKLKYNLIWYHSLFN